MGDGGGEVEDDLIRLTCWGAFGVLLTTTSTSGIAGDRHLIGILSIHLDSFITPGVGPGMSLVRCVQDGVILIRSAANFIRSAASGVAKAQSIGPAVDASPRAWPAIGGCLI